MEANQQYPEGRNLSYAQYVSKFVYVKKIMCWKPRKKVVKGSTSYEDIRTVSDIQYSTFRDTCFAPTYQSSDPRLSEKFSLERESSPGRVKSWAILEDSRLSERGSPGRILA
ncbi:hypothetical protein Lal_00000903 [Lupinus albus]|nr:hypothetical protein Lal_00000903 [Lupinus albus]